MKRLLAWLLKPIVLSLIGVVLLSLVIWFEAPLLTFDEKPLFAARGVRWFWIGVLFVLWAGYFAWRLLATRIANARLMAGVTATSAPAAPSQAARESQAELDLLGKRLNEAMQILRNSATKRGGNSLYQLPWYMFVGAPGAGKTTALVQSGLNFPLADKLGKGALGGVGGTRNCDWWFTDEAVLLDTAGRYTTQDSHEEVDQSAWRGFLQLLRKHRRRRPINGVILAVSVPDLLQQDEAARQVQAQAIRARIKDLHEQLNIRFPIYVLVTKCDLLAGFSEFFCNLGKEQRAQVWGVTFPLPEDGSAEAALAAFPAEFHALELQLQARLMERMESERDMQRRMLIYGFPQQFGGMGEVLQGFLREIFQGSRYEEAGLLRGVYFTSGTQEGHPIDRVMGALASAYGLERHALPANVSSGRSYFLTRLLQEVIFAEAEVAGVNQKFERQRQRLQWGALGAIAVVFALVSIGLVNSYARNVRLVDRVDARTAEVEALAAQVRPDSSVVQLLPFLDAARRLPTGYDERNDSAPWLMRFGLYQGEKLGDGSQTLYQRTLRATLLPRIKLRLEEQLRRGSANPLDYLYETLRVYLMLGDGVHFNQGAVAGWLLFDWQRNLRDATPAQREALAQHAQALLQSYRNSTTQVPLDGQLIADARLQLARMPLSQRVYSRIKRELAKAGLAEFSVATAAGRDPSQVLARRNGEALTRGVPGIYTLAGYARFRELGARASEEASADNWVLAREEAVSAGSSAALRRDLDQLYFNDYIAEWDKLLGDVRIAPFATLEQGARIATVLSGADSPLRRFLLAASKETTFADSGAAKPAASLSSKLKDSAGAVINRLESAMGSEPEPAAAAPAQHPVDQHFEELHRMTAGSPSALDGVLAQMKELAAYFDAAGAARRAGAPPPAPAAAASLARTVEANGAMLRTMLKDVDSGSAALTNGGERARLDALWGAEAGQFCRRAIAGRYPLVRNAAQEATRDDFGRFFAPGGMADRYFKDNLAPYVEMRDGPWRWRASADRVTLGMPQQVLEFFQRAAQIRDAFFSGGGSEPSMRFELKLLAADPAWTNVQLEIDGQPVPFGPPASVRPAAIQLPSGKGGGVVRLETVGGTPQSLRTEGGWAWLRMVDRGQLEAGPQGERYKLSFDLDGRKLVYSLTANSVINPFRREPLEQFRCLDRL
jgi:type VI secretion system protein ImpL